MKRPKLYHVRGLEPFAIANLSKNHPLWGMPARLFNTTAPADRPKAAADFIAANKTVLTNPRKPVVANDPTRPVKRRTTTAGLVLASLAAGMVGGTR